MKKCNNHIIYKNITYKNQGLILDTECTLD